MINKSQVKLVVQTEEEYYTLFNYFKNNNIKFHTYQQKENRNIRRIIKGLSADFPIENIKQVFESYENITVKNLAQIRHLINKKPLPIFKIEFEFKPNINQILIEITSINDFIIKLEFPNKTKEVIQCKKCLSLGHSQNFCFRNPRCIICGDFHCSDTCPIKLEAIKTCAPVMPTCALCGGAHFGNYKGCKVQKEINKKRFPPIKSQNISSNKVAPGVSYARVLSEANKPPAYNPVSYNETKEIINNDHQYNYDFFNERLSNLEKIIINQVEAIANQDRVMTNLINTIVLLSKHFETLITRMENNDDP